MIEVSRLYEFIRRPNREQAKENGNGRSERLGAGIFGDLFRRVIAVFQVRHVKEDDSPQSVITPIEGGHKATNQTETPRSS